MVVVHVLGLLEIISPSSNVFFFFFLSIELFADHYFFSIPSSPPSSRLLFVRVSSLRNVDVGLCAAVLKDGVK
jgi:hypothetical protein